MPPPPDRAARRIRRRRIARAARALVVAVATAIVVAGPAAPAVSLDAAGTSSIAGGAVLTGTVSWAVDTPARYASVQFWADGRFLGQVTKPPFRFPLRTRRLGNGVHRLGWAVVLPGGTRFTPQVGQVLVANGLPAAATAPGSITYSGDWETGNASQWSALECGNVPSEFQIENSLVRQGRYAARFEIRPGDVWSGDGTVRCLAGAYDTGETQGDDDWFAFSMYVPSGYFGSNLIWELHQPASLYEIPGCGVAPFALHAQASALEFRVATGDCVQGAGATYWRPNLRIPGLDPFPRDQWIDFIVHIDFAESGGEVQLWYRVGSGAWTVQPDLALYGISTLPYCDALGIHDVKLYTELGLYAGAATTGGDSVVYLDGYRRGTSYTAVATGFPPVGGAADAVG